MGNAKLALLISNHINCPLTWGTLVRVKTDSVLVENGREVETGCGLEVLSCYYYYSLKSDVVIALFLILLQYIVITLTFILFLILSQQFV